LSSATGASFYCKASDNTWAQFANPSAGSGTVINDATLVANRVILGNGTVHATVAAADSTTTHAFFATAGAPAFRAIVAGDIPTLNQSTSGTAATITGLLATANTPLTVDQDILFRSGSGLGRLPIVTIGQCLGNTAGAWASIACSGGGGTPGGVSSNIQLNVSSAFGADSTFTWDSINKCLNVDATVAAGCGAQTPIPLFYSKGVATNAHATFQVDCTTSITCDAGVALKNSGTYGWGVLVASPVASNQFQIQDNGAVTQPFAIQTGAPTGSILITPSTVNVLSNLSIGSGIDIGLCRGAAGQVNVNDGTSTCTNLRDLFARSTSTGDGTVAGEDRLYELAANGSNFRSWLVPDVLTADLKFRFSNTLPTAGQVMTFGTPSGGISDVTFATPATGGGPGFSGSVSLGTGAITSGACATAVTSSQTGMASTDSLSWAFNADPTGVTGYSPSTSGMLTIVAYPTTNTANFKVCNNTASSITPGAITLNFAASKGAIATGTSALGTGAITSGACATVVTTSATGAATTSSIAASFNADPTAVTGYSPTTGGMLTIIGYPTTDDVNFKVCNNTTASITPGAITLNWRVF
jgi:hypothetical protein